MANVRTAEPWIQQYPVFCGDFLGGSIPVGRNWQTVRYECVVNEDVANAFVQINLAEDTGTIWLGKVRIESRPVDSEQWQTVVDENPAAEGVWNQRWKLVQRGGEYGASAVAEGNGSDLAVAVMLNRLGANPWDVQIVSRTGMLQLLRGRCYRISFQIRSSKDIWPVTSYLMTTNPLRFYGIGGKNNLLATGKLATAAGVPLLSTGVVMPWPEEGIPASFTSIDEKMSLLAREFPQTKWIIRFGIEPPAWWRKRYPDELEQWENGVTGRYVCVASAQWRKDVVPHIRELIKHLEAKWGRVISYYHVQAQSSGEWYYPIWDNPKAGAMNFSPSFRVGYQEYLRKRYTAIAMLNSAWQSRYADFAEIRVPDGPARPEAASGLFSDPGVQAHLIDFTLYQQIAMQEALELAAQTIKSVAPGKRAGAFYGYTFELPGCQDGIAAAGQLRLGDMLRSSALDVFSSITTYHDRGSDGVGALMAPMESISLHAKVALVENDHRTHLSRPNAGYYRTTTSALTRSVLMRDYFRCLTHHSATWMFDLYGQGWYDDAGLWQGLFGLGRDYAAAIPQSPAFNHDVAVIIDEKSFLALKPGCELTRPLVYLSRFAINAMGTTSSSYLLEDLLAGKVAPHKLYIFLNAFWFTGEERNALRKHLAVNGATVLWLYAPGYVTDRGLSLTAMQDLTGFELQPLPAITTPSTQTVRFDGADLDMSTSGVPAMAAPDTASAIFEVLPAAGVRALGRFSDSRKIAAAERRMDGFRSVFLALPTLSPEFLAAIARMAGVHLFTTPGVSVLTDGKLLGVFAPHGFSGEVRLPRSMGFLDSLSPARQQGQIIPICLPNGGFQYFRIFPNP